MTLDLDPRPQLATVDPLLMTHDTRLATHDPQQHLTLVCLLLGFLFAVSCYSCCYSYCYSSSSSSTSNKISKPIVLFNIQDEIINVVTSLPHTNDAHADILKVRTSDEEDETPGVGESATNGILAQAVEGHREDVTTADGKSRLVIPSSFFKKPKHHPLEIFVSFSSHFCYCLITGAAEVRGQIFIYSCGPPLFYSL